MQLLTGYLWTTTGDWERHIEGGVLEVQTHEAKFLVFHEDGEGGAYVLTENNEAPSLNWGEVEEYIPGETLIGRDLAVLDSDESAGYTVWIAEANGENNEVTVLASSH
jgi:hypothetical protein